MGRSLVVAVLALVGLLCAAGMGYAAYVVSRGSVAVPVTRLQQTPAQQLTPAKVRTKAVVRTHSKPLETTTTTRAATTTVDDHSGRSPGGSDSGSGGGGHGGDDD
jgi:flagellar basal body-associated protein FliL